MFATRSLFYARCNQVIEILDDVFINQFGSVFSEKIVGVVVSLDKFVFHDRVSQTSASPLGCLCSKE